MAAERNPNAKFEGVVEPTPFGEMDFEQDALVADDSKLCSVNELAQMQLEAEAEVAEAERKLKEAQEALRKIQEVELPNAMKAAGIDELKLANGAKITIKEDLSISVGQARMPFVVSWLKRHGHGDIVKREMNVTLPKGMLQKDVDVVVKAVKAFKLVPEVGENVHSQTLKALLKEQREKGADIKLEDFGAYEFKKSIIKLPKE